MNKLRGELTMGKQGARVHLVAHAKPKMILLEESQPPALDRCADAFIIPL